MIAIIVVTLLSISVSNVLASTSYSKVFVEREISPVEYYQYGAPYTSLLSPRLAQINSLPAINTYLPPCGTPCLVSGQTAPLAPLNGNTNVLTYKPPVPSVPVVITPAKEDAAGYQYSYVVYDDNTGDHKAQRELSDGGVVRGEYSFLQPDGYVREVQYVADDIKGFNAVVKNFLPISIESKSKNDPSLPLPCPEIKLESLKEASQEESNGSSEKLTESPLPASIEMKDDPVESKETTDENSTKEANDNASVEDKSPTTEKTGSKDESSPEIKVDSEEPSNETTEPEKPEEIPQEATTESLKDQSNENATEESKEAPESPTEAPKESSEQSNENNSDQTVDIVQNTSPEQEILVPYNDVIRCIQAAINKANLMPAALREGPSPLTYIILNKPC